MDRIKCKILQNISNFLHFLKKFKITCKKIKKLYNKIIVNYLIKRKGEIKKGVVLAELIQTVKKKEDSYVDKLPLLKFIGVLAILLTFIVFNFILAGDREMYLNFQINSVLFHIILPILYVLDWFLFYERGKVKITYPVCSTIFPIVYVIFIFIRAWILNFDPTVPYIYPYFFLNLDKLGVVGVIKWVVLLALGFVVVGFLFYGIDKALSKNKKNKI